MLGNNYKRRAYKTVINSITKATCHFINFTRANKKGFRRNYNLPAKISWQEFKKSIIQI